MKFVILVLTVVFIVDIIATEISPSLQLVKMVKFNNGQQYPILGLGTWQTTSDLQGYNQTEIYKAIKSGIDIGYRHFDCAAHYNNEKFVGMAINEKIKEGVITREEIFITDKLMNDKHNPEEVVDALKDSLKLLGLDYLDLYLIHWPMSAIEIPVANENQIRYIEGNYSYLDTWKSMERCVQLGLTKSIGISNFNMKQVKDILGIATIIPVVNQVENHPYLTQNKLKEFCETNGILLTAYGPLGLPYIFTKSLPYTNKTIKKAVLLDDPIVKKIAAKYKKTSAQILIRFQIQRAVLVIPKSSNPVRQKENFEVWDFAIGTEEMNLLELLNQNLRYISNEQARHLKDYPFNEKL
ncbi:1,5-anhydro-D-fructose reductase-like [Sipha flava]|uniref:1,5-anhydro-D-fructose reductase-like n=1 Tax=Sipha flava TaxID=143950 RepID=A0A2S2QAV2_9HEMI|nr:1,5-anhydro-D-fructose reductase-like [Sipha flava]